MATFYISTDQLLYYLEEYREFYLGTEVSNKRPYISPYDDARIEVIGDNYVVTVNGEVVAQEPFTLETDLPVAIYNASHRRQGPRLTTRQGVVIDHYGMFPELLHSDLGVIRTFEAWRRGVVVSRSREEEIARVTEAVTNMLPVAVDPDEEMFRRVMESGQRPRPVKRPIKLGATQEDVNDADREFRAEVQEWAASLNMDQRRLMSRVSNEHRLKNPKIARVLVGLYAAMSGLVTTIDERLLVHFRYTSKLPFFSRGTGLANVYFEFYGDSLLTNHERLAYIGDIMFHTATDREIFEFTYQALRVQFDTVVTDKIQLLFEVAYKQLLIRGSVQYLSLMPSVKYYSSPQARWIAESTVIAANSEVSEFRSSIRVTDDIDIREIVLRAYQSRGTNIPTDDNTIRSMIRFLYGIIYERQVVHNREFNTPLILFLFHERHYLPLFPAQALFRVLKYAQVFQLRHLYHPDVLAELEYFSSQELVPRFTTYTPPPLVRLAGENENDFKERMYEDVRGIQFTQELQPLIIREAPAVYNFLCRYFTERNVHIDHIERRYVDFQTKRRPINNPEDGLDFAQVFAYLFNEARYGIVENVDDGHSVATVQVPDDDLFSNSSDDSQATQQVDLDLGRCLKCGKHIKQ